MKKRACLILALLLLGTMLTGCQMAERMGRYVWDRLYAQEETAAVPEKVLPEPMEETASMEETEPAPEPGNTEETETPEEPGAYRPGVRTDTGYENESLGLRFTMTENMVMASDAELQQIMGQGMDEIVEEGVLSQDAVDLGRATTSYELYAVDLISGGSISLMVENLPMAGITERIYIEAYRSSMGQTTLEVSLGEPEEMELGGMQFVGVDGVLGYNEQEIGQRLLVKKVEDRKMLVVILSYLSQEDLDALLECFSLLG